MTLQLERPLLAQLKGKDLFLHARGYRWIHLPEK